MGSAGAPGRLRGELTEFVGRQAELALVRQAVGSARLVTLTGPGGIGKTRLALQAASGLRRAFRDGVWLAELGSLQDPALLVPELARSLGLSDQSARWAVATLADYLATRRVLLVLDGCEHLADACAVLAEALLRGCPELRIIATSRHVLAVAGECTVAVPPMAVPANCQPAIPEDLLQYEAVRLFAARAAAVLPGFTLDADSGAPVAGICRRLDGIPLAVELAAVRLRSLSPGQILSRLDSRFPLLSGGGPAGQPHHQTLRDALEWSYGLLTGGEQAMWRMASVFAGSFDLDAAEAVCAGSGIAAGQAADLIDGLVAKSILSRGDGHGKARYRLLDTIGEFGLQKLRADGNERQLRLQHRDWYAALASWQEAFGPRRPQWIATLNTEHENLRAALEFSLSEPQETAAGAEMACDLWRYWETHGHLTEGRRILAAALERLDKTAAVRPRALWVAGYLAELQGDLPSAQALLEAALPAARQADDGQAVAYASAFLGYVLYRLGNAGQGRALAETALRLHQESGDQTGMAMSLTELGFMHLHSGNPTPAAERFRECAQLAESCGNVWGEKYARWGLGVTAWLLDDHRHAATQVRAALHAARDMDDSIGVATCLDTLGWVAASQKKWARALTMLAAADATWAAIPALLPGGLQRHHDAALAAARGALPLRVSTAAFSTGAAMSQAEAIAFALGESSRSVSRPDGMQAGGNHPRLTRREQEVAVLVARGLSNSQIAATLVISARTVETHVQHIMDKLGFHARAEIAAWSTAQSQAHQPPSLTTHGSGSGHQSAYASPRQPISKPLDPLPQTPAGESA
jgi:predicted ATPase/DNA-binding NarL/FixJ family response regulator